MTALTKPLRPTQAQRDYRNYHRWTEEEREIVRREYDSTRATTERLARQLGVSFYAIKGVASKTGVMQPRQGRTWTKAEVATLERLIEHSPVKAIASKLKRSVVSVILKAQRLHLARRYRDGWYTKIEVCGILGEDHHWIQRQIDHGALRATSHSGVKPSQKGRAMWHIEAKDLKAFIRANSHLLRGRNVDLPAIVDILCGVLYEHPSDPEVVYDDRP